MLRRLFWFLNCPVMVYQWFKMVYQEYLELLDLT